MSYRRTRPGFFLKKMGGGGEE